MNDATHEAWVAEAREVSAEAALSLLRPGHPLKREGTERVGPCPVCGGRDRFSLAPRKGLWNCRACGTGGGDGLSLAMHVEGVEFLRACEILVGRPDPRGGRAETAEERAAREAEAARRAAEVEAKAARREALSAGCRERERRLTRKLWDEAQPLAGTLAELYLLHRGLAAPAGAHLRYAPTHGYFVPPGPRPTSNPEARGPGPRLVWRGPALLAAITDADGVWRGLHATWLDPRLGQGPGALPASADGKATIADPETGEVLAAKKTRGSARGGRIVLRPLAAPVGLIRGEGIETALSVWASLGVDPAYAGWAVDAALSLGNLAGPAAASVPHPTERVIRADGTEGHFRRVPGPVPDFSAPVAPVPDSVTMLIHLGDGDSEPFLTAMALERAAARQHRPGRTIRTAMAPPGEDFNTIWRRAAAAEAQGVAA